MRCKQSDNTHTHGATDAGRRPPRPCERRDLTRWAVNGGLLPSRLANHVQQCSACADYVRRVNQTHAALMFLSHQTLPPALHARANGRALRMLRRVERSSASAARLLRMRPDLSLFERARVHLIRVSCGAAAAMLVLLLRAGTQQGITYTLNKGQTMASLHFERHIDPDGEWLT